MPNPFYSKDVISIKEFGRGDLEYLFSATDKVSRLSRSEMKTILSEQILGLMFFEPSTRTRLSFEAAMLSLGGKVIGFSEPRTSSVQKGENLADTVRTVEGYCDALVLRHPMEGAARFAAEISSVPLLNAGSGAEEHPTQAMLDLYTIIKEKGRVDGLNVTIVGDLKYGRTVYSLLYGLSKFNPSAVNLVSPQSLRIRKEALYDLEGKVKLTEYQNLDEVMVDTDVIYVTRIQKERFPDPLEYEKVSGSYVIDNTLLSKGKDNLIVMHPLPRVGEIKPEVDSTPRAKYFAQTRWGKVLRAALIALTLKPDSI